MAFVFTMVYSGRKRHGFWVKMFLSGSLQPCILFFSLTSGSRCVLCFTLLPLIHSLSLQFWPKEAWILGQDVFVGFTPTMYTVLFPHFWLPLCALLYTTAYHPLPIAAICMADFLAKNGEEEKAQ
ncbi:hypothetical protein JHK82_039507 [Glycine max]|nr:hypothetical protein JHK82_039507 [Glycine max]KAG5121571.1 hypothetical protein JHK84_039911 [Glycine max]